MSFDTALLNLVGAGLGVVGSRAFAVSDRLIRQTDPAELVDFLSREGCGRGLALLAQDVARPLVTHYRGDPDRVIRHIQQSTALLPDQALSADPAVQAVWVKVQEQLRAPPTEHAAQTDSADAEHLCRQLTDAVLAQPRKVGMMAKADLDDALIHEILHAVLQPVIKDRTGIAHFQPALEKFAEQRKRARSKTAQGGRGKFVGASTSVHARMDASRAHIGTMSSRTGIPLVLLTSIATSLIACCENDDELRRRLDAKGSAYKELDSWLTRPADFDAAVATLRAQSGAALASARFDLADRLLAQAEDVDLSAARERVEQEGLHLVQASETRMLRGCIEELRCQYKTAAAHCATAATYLPTDDLRGRWRLMMRQAQILARQSEEFGDFPSLEQAVALHQTCLHLRPRQTASKEWAITQHAFGTLLCRLSDQQDDIAPLHRAVQACRAAADELIGQREPMRWAQCLADYAVALNRVGERTGDQAALTDALAAQRETLAVFTRSTSPQDWAQAQIGIASTLLLIAMRDGSHHRLSEAIAAYRSALEVLDADQVPEQSIKARIRLSEALCLVARRDGQPRHVIEAEHVLSALKSDAGTDRVSKDRMPLEWARLQAIRGTVELELGRRSRSGDRLIRATELLESALELTSAQMAPLQFAGIHRDMGSAFEALSLLERFAEPRLTQAVAAYREAVSALDRDTHTQLWAHTGLDLARALHLLGLESGLERWLSESLIVEQAALDAIRTLADPSLIAFVEDGLAERKAHMEKMRRSAQVRR